jgi:hypothetical protein
MAAGSSWASNELSTWGSAEVVERMGYEHRRAIQDAIGDLGDMFAEHDLELRHYLHADKRSGRYGRVAVASGSRSTVSLCFVSSMGVVGLT